MPSVASDGCKKRASNRATVAGIVEDHRKLPRNRATKSCLNCFKSKRMCDRKRPCTRCTQLGLTGLCVYEVDDPDRTRDNEGDIPHLQRRIGELESIIRELKNKPHPRWASPSEPFDMGAGLRNLGPPTPSPTVSSRSISGSVSPPTCTTPARGLPGVGLPPGVDQELMVLLRALNQAPSTHFEDPAGPSQFNFVGQIADDACGIGFVQNGKQAVCACVTEPANYHVLLELSLRLRRAANMLSYSAQHAGSTTCPLLQRIVEVDALINETLGNTHTIPSSSFAYPFGAGDASPVFAAHNPTLGSSPPGTPSYMPSAADSSSVPAGHRPLQSPQLYSFPCHTPPRRQNDSVSWALYNQDPHVLHHD
ncbi:hypothetical protein PUNSTDRAFT_103324 [Punctularia strigosozonata HHB-11173 SS5]|uniref:uncharacterized protein n=1 Tax=Punctularia strigosozonata (strain HHB-11173) TaxID=741275 RepID=UPI0004417118|nr:uncharacterized protein PUNSTDRAFT_103324 [Punctularia strigosozonata HHB-11173 SS5]EIN08465.1 hypothetical protein PUNSTDRAFT_103324 [Punctularia strigosozonata HHB-11173 SS5]